MDKTIKKENAFRSKLQNLLSLFSSTKQEDVCLNEKQELLAEIEKALSDLRVAKNCFEDAKDPEMIEACIYEIKSAEARYGFLLRKAKLMANSSNKASV